MKTNRKISLPVAIALTLGFLGGSSTLLAGNGWWQGNWRGQSHKTLPDHSEVREALDTVVNDGNNAGFGLQMWATLVNRDGQVCVVGFLRRRTWRPVAWQPGDLSSEGEHRQCL